MSASHAVDVRVTGRVQGVSFRMYAEREALRLGVTGWVRNEPDGSVAGHFEGDPIAVNALVAWCGAGPAFAEVDDVDVFPADVSGVSGFTVRI